MAIIVAIETTKHENSNEKPSNICSCVLVEDIDVIEKN